MSSIIRVTRHPSDPDVVLVHTPPGLANELGRFEPARYAAEHRAYVMHGDHMAALYRFARTITCHVVDERVTRGSGPGTPPRECAGCGQPGSMGKPPKVCPACGVGWVPTPPPVTAVRAPMTECRACGHRQTGRFPFCSACGGQMVYAPRREPPPTFQTAAQNVRRRRSAEPARLDELLEQLAAPQRPVVDVELPPDPAADDGGEGW